MLQRSQVTGNRKARDCACLISNFRNVSLHTNPLQSSIVKYNKNETCGNLLLNKNLKGKACRSYDGEVMPFLKLPPSPPPPPQNLCVTSKAKGPLKVEMANLFNYADRYMNENMSIMYIYILKRCQKSIK